MTKLESISHKHKDFVAINDDFQNGMAVFNGCPLTHGN
jgi:hypothetical protein